jgi:hypothetical protein
MRVLGCRHVVLLAVLLPPLAAGGAVAHAERLRLQGSALSANAVTSDANGPRGIFRIAGRVVNAKTGEPLARAQVTLADTRSRTAAINVVTGNDGHFEFPGLSASKYSLTGSKRGFLSAGYEQHEFFSTAIVTGPNFATDELELRLMPTALISGHVYDEFGEGIRGASVVLYAENRVMGMVRTTDAARAMTDDRGYYEFALLQPGNYYVAADAKPWYATHATQQGPRTATSEPVTNSADGLDVAYPTTYYGGATEADGAAATTVSGGEYVQMDLHLNPVTAIRVLFRAPPNPDGVVNFRPPSFIKRAFGSPDEISTAETRQIAPGVFEVSGIAPGHYTVRSSSHDGGGMQQSEDVDLSRSGQELDDSSGTALASVKLNLKMLGGEPPLSIFSVSLFGPEQRPVSFGQGSSVDGALLEVVPGRYAMQLFGGEKNHCVMRVTSASGTTEGHDVVIGPGTGQELTAYVAAGNVTVEGTVQKKGKPVAGVMVALIPRDPEHHLEMFRRDQSDFDGTFSMGSVVPGTYTLVAVEDAWGSEWMKPGVLERYISHGQTVTIGELMRGSVKLSDAEEVQPR